MVDLLMGMSLPAIAQGRWFSCAEPFLWRSQANEVRVTAPAARQSRSGRVADACAELLTFE